MAYYQIEQIFAYDRKALARVDELLGSEGLKRDKNLDYICGVYDENRQMVATGSCFASTLRCFAVSPVCQGEGILNQLLSHLIAVQYERGNTHLFLYTKPGSAKFFKDLGFYEIARPDDKLVFMENRSSGFSSYLKRLSAESPETSADARIGAVVMNANPFTLGHRYLVETAAAACDLVHVFVVSEDVSRIPFAVRKELVKKGTLHLPNVILHDSGSYMISSAVFPSYFLGGEEAVVMGHGRLDIRIFGEIARTLGITDRFIGEEPYSVTTAIYNRIMEEELPKAGVACHVIPRKNFGEEAISASRVRRLWEEGELELLKELVPEATAEYLCRTAK